MPKPAFADWKTRAREACSWVLYQEPITRMKPGLMQHSKRPWRARRARRCRKLEAKPMQRTTRPQASMYSDKVRPMR